MIVDTNHWEMHCKCNLQSLANVFGQNHETSGDNERTEKTSFSGDPNDFYPSLFRYDP
jgi:hypothetical protein